MSGVIVKLKHLFMGVMGLAVSSPVAGGFAEVRGDAAQAMAADPQVFVLDVRTPEEYAAGHLKGATLIPVHELEQRLGELPAKDKKMLVYCAVGGRSGRASQLLAQKGWSAISNLAGGINGWIAEDRPVVKD